MAVSLVTLANPIRALDLNAYHNWLIDGTVTDQVANLIYSGSSDAVTLTQNGSGGILTLSGTVSTSANMTDVGLLTSKPSLTGTGSSNSLKHVHLNPTITTANVASAGARVLTVRGTFTLNGSGTGVNAPAAIFTEIGNTGSVTINQDSQIIVLQLNFPSTTLNGHSLTGNTATLAILGAPASGFSVLDTTAGKWQSGSGGLTVPGGGITVTGSITGQSSPFTITSSNNLQLNGALLFLQAGGTNQVQISTTSITALNPLVTKASATGGAGFNMPSGTAPTSPVDGDFWYDGTNLKFRHGGTTQTITWT